MPIPAEDIEVVRLSRKHPLSWALMPQVLDRALAFGVERGQRDIEMTLNKIQGTFAYDLEQVDVPPFPPVVVWVTVQRSTGKIVGHLIVTEDLWSGRKVGMVLQLAIDAGVLPRAVMRSVNEELKAWVRARGATETFAITDQFNPQAWEVLFGFKEYRMVIRQELGEG